MKVAWNRLGSLRWWAGEQRVSSATKNTGQSASKSSDTPQETKHSVHSALFQVKKRAVRRKH